MKILNLHKNDKIELNIESLTSEGSAIGRHDGLAVFVRGAVPGDKIIAHIIKVSKNYAVGIIDSIAEPSPARIESDCSVSEKCGGCSFRNVDYKAELGYKKQRVEDTLLRIGHLNVSVKSVIGADDTLRYRNKAQYPVKIENGEMAVGFYAYKSHRIVHCMDCKLQPEIFSKGLAAVDMWVKENGVTSYDEKKGTGLLRHIYFREGFATNEIMACLVINSKTIPNEDRLVEILRQNIPNLKSVIININTKKTNVILGSDFKTIWGSDTISDVLLGKKFIISPQSFYQVNHSQCEKLYDCVRTLANVKKNEILLDMYCGAGTIGLSMAEDCRELIGVEIVESAVSNAKENAKINKINNARFICSDAQTAAKQLANEGTTVDVVILDPPRKGCDQGVFDALEQMQVNRIVYVSCDASTLARDLAVLKQKDYEIKSVIPVDMFPRTPHVETVVLMTKIDS